MRILKVVGKTITSSTTKSFPPNYIEWLEVSRSFSSQTKLDSGEAACTSRIDLGWIREDTTSVHEGGEERTLREKYSLSRGSSTTPVVQRTASSFNILRLSRGWEPLTDRYSLPYRLFVVKILISKYKYC